jgi:uncharacterized protein (TIGR03546 family)
MLLPRPIRKMLAILRGGVSPVFIFLSVTLGFSFGLMPSFSGYHIAIIIVTLILNVHTGLFLISAGLGKSLCFAAAPVLYHVGIVVQDYLSFLLRLFSSIPIIGITDFSKYSTAGALVLGPIIGAVAGLLLARSVISFRRAFLKFEEGSERFKKWYSNPWVRVLDRILIGRRTKDAKSLFTAKTKYIRKAGVVLAVLLLVACAVVISLIKDNKIKNYAETKMTQANRAEVDIGGLQISPLTGSLSVSQIQVTDPEKPQNNQFAAEKIIADADVYDLLLGKVVIDELQASNIKFDQPRAKPGKIVETGTQPKPPIFDANDFALTKENLNKLETYIKDAKALKQRLQKLQKWLPKDKKTAKQTREIPQKYLDYLRARAPIAPSPRILAKKAVLDNVQIPSPLLGNSKVTLANISDAPQTAGLPINLELTSYDTPASVSVTLDYSTETGEPKITGTFKGFDLGKMQSGLSSNAGLFFESGTASGDFQGKLNAQSMDVTINVTLDNMQAKSGAGGILGLDSTTSSEVLDAVHNLKTTIRVVGPISEPRLVFDSKGLTEQFKQKLAEAGKQRLQEELDKRLKESLGDKVPGELKKALEKPSDLIEGLGGLLKKKDNKEK